MDGIFNVLLIPLVAGYYLRYNLFFFEPKSMKLSPQRVLFESIISGIWVTIAFFLIRVLIQIFCPEIIDNIYTRFYSSEIPKIPFLITSITTFFGVITISTLTNKIVRKYNPRLEQKVYAHAIRKNGDEFDRKFLDSMLSGIPIQLSMKNGKVYVGYCAEIPETKTTNYCVIFPLKSGYRAKETHEITFTTYYDEAYDQYIEQNQDNNIDELTDPSITLNQSEVVSVRFYDEELENIFYFNALANVGEE